MAQTSNRFFDEAARLMNDAAGVASGVRREFDTMLRHQAERILGDLDVVKREEFEAVKEMARLAREENEALKARIAALEASLAAKPAETKFADAASGRRPPIWAPVNLSSRSGGRNGLDFGPGFLVFGPRHRYRTAACGSSTPGGMSQAKNPAIMLKTRTD